MNDYKNPRSIDGVRPVHTPPIVRAVEKPQTQRVPHPRGNKFLKFTVTTIIVVIVLLLGIVGARAINLSSKIFVGQTSIYQKLSALIRPNANGTTLVGEDLGQINVLLLGIGGEGHDGPYLTDTMILAQIRPADHKITMTSIPRDYFTPVENIGYRKINAAFAEGFNRNKSYDEAGRWARDTVEQLSGLSIPYFAVLDFKGFKEAIDLIGGVNVHIDRTFTDYSFPNDATNGYLAPVTFTAGDEHMNGDRALIFARSRHAAGPEGSDFARSQRQQKIIHAAKEKILSLNLITDAGKLNGLLSIFGNHFHTNVAPSELLHLYTLLKDYSKNDIISLSLDPDTGLVCNSITEDGAYILSPCTGKTKADIEAYFKDSFNSSAAVATQHGIVWLADTNKSPATYKAAEKKLSAAGFTVYNFNFAGVPLDQTLVYSVNDIPGAVDFITSSLHATTVTVPPPGIKIDKTKVDLLIILGKDAVPNTTIN